MPRQMPALASQFRAKCSTIVEVPDVAEALRADPAIGAAVRERLTVYRCASLYEQAYLRMFGAWEQFLENVMLRYLCGYTNGAFNCVPLNGAQASLAHAMVTFLGNKDFVLLHSPNALLNNLNRLFAPGDFQLVINSSLQPIRDFAHIRHRIAHDHSDARQKFDQTCDDLAGRRFQGARPGLLLRYWTTFDGANVRWLGRIESELANIAAQIAP